MRREGESVAAERPDIPAEENDDGRFVVVDGEKYLKYEDEDGRSHLTKNYVEQDGHFYEIMDPDFSHFHTFALSPTPTFHPAYYPLLTTKMS